MEDKLKAMKHETELVQPKIDLSIFGQKTLLVQPKIDFSVFNQGLSAYKPSDTMVKLFGKKKADTLKIEDS